MLSKEIVLVVLQLLISNGFLLDNIVDIVHVVTPVGKLVGKIETIDFDGQQYKVKTFMGTLTPNLQPGIEDFGGQFQHRTLRIHFMRSSMDMPAFREMTVIFAPTFQCRKIVFSSIYLLHNVPVELQIFL